MIFVPFTPCTNDTVKQSLDPGPPQPSDTCTPSVWDSLLVRKDQPPDEHVRRLGAFCSSRPTTTTGDSVPWLLCSRPKARHLPQREGWTQILLVLFKGPLQLFNINRSSSHTSYFLLRCWRDF